MVAPTIYRSDDVSAPVLSGEVGKLITLLDAILVNGYGAKPAAGWTKPYSGTNYAAYRQGSGLQHYLQVNDTAAQLSRVIGYVTMSDVLTGTMPFPTEAQFSQGLYCRKSITANTTARPWICFATNSTFYLFILGGSATLTSFAGGDSNLAFGQLDGVSVPADAYCSFLMAATDTSTNSVTAGPTRQVIPAFSTTALLGHYVSGSYAQAAGSVNNYKRTSSLYSQAQSGAATGGVAYPDPATGGLHISEIYSMEGSNIMRGKFPGLFALNHPYTSLTHLDTFNGNGALSGRAFQIVHSGISSVVIETNGGW